MLSKLYNQLLAATTIMIAIAGCGKPKSLPAAELVRYIERESNGFKKEVKAGDWVYTVQYKPADYVIAMEAHGIPDPATYQIRQVQLSGTATYNITFRNEKEKTEPLRIGIGDEAAYNDRLNYFLNQAPGDIRLVSGSDTLVPTGYVFEPNYNMMPEQRLVVSFRIPENKKNEHPDQQLILTDRVFNNGIIKARFDGNDLASAPGLKM